MIFAALHELTSHFIMLYPVFKNPMINRIIYKTN